MPTFKNRLDELLADTVLASGILRQNALDAVRQYVKEISVDQLRREIAALTSLTELNMLQAAGVPLAAQPQFFYQVQKLQVQ
jgi:hypothetical protein